MNRYHDPPTATPERVWLHRSQWRTVATLVLLLAAVVVSLALAAGFWWTLRAREAAKIARPLSPPIQPVATQTIPASSFSVIEVYPATMTHPSRPQVAVRSPGGLVTEVTVRAGQWVHAGQAVASLKQENLAPVKRRAAVSFVPPREIAPAREPKQGERLRHRLDEVRAEIQRLQVSARAALRPGGELRRAQAAAQESERGVERAREALAVASYRRHETDQQYQAHHASRFRLHFARSAELLAQVELHHAEDEADTTRQSLAAVSVAVDETASSRPAARIASLGAEANTLEARLSQIHEQVAGARQRLDLPTVQRQMVVARAPRSGIVAAVWANRWRHAPQGAPLLVIAAPGRACLRARVPQRALTAFPPGAPVTIRRRDGQRFTGRVARVRRAGAGAGLVEVILPANARLEEGMALVPPRAGPTAHLLPIAALTRGTRGPVVWVAMPKAGIAGGWIAHQRAVRTAGTRGNRIAIVAGLSPGDHVMVAGTRGLREGQSVAPVEVDPLQAS